MFIASACSAVTLSPVIINPNAFCMPTMRGKKNVPPESGINPIFEKAWINEADCLAIVKSHAKAMFAPVIAAVNGVAAGAGANIALACDLTIANQSASFIQAFSKIGLIPDSGGTFFLPRIVGMQKALGLMMTGDKVTAEQADAMNMIYKAVPDESFEEEVTKLAETLAKMPTRGLGLTKKAVNQSFSNDLTEQLALEEELQTEAGQTEDFSEGVNAFLEKRKPEFVGR